MFCIESHKECIGLNSVYNSDIRQWERSKKKGQEYVLLMILQ